MAKQPITSVKLWSSSGPWATSTAQVVRGQGPNQKARFFRGISASSIDRLGTVADRLRVFGCFPRWSIRPFRSPGGFVGYVLDGNGPFPTPRIHIVICTP